MAEPVQRTGVTQPTAAFGAPMEALAELPKMDSMEGTQKRAASTMNPSPEEIGELFLLL
jgi:hypothetical protein